MACAECKDFIYCPKCGKKTAWYKQDGKGDRYRLAIYKCDHKNLRGVAPYSEIVECRRCETRFALLY